MDGRATFQGVLDPGERLVWAGEPKQTLGSAVAGLPVFAIILVVLGSAFRMALAHWNGPFPWYLRMELAVVAAFLCFPFYWFARQLNRVRNTAYALTNRRLLVAVGTQREKMRAVELEALDPVQIIHSRGGGQVLRFSRKGQDAAAPVWTFLDGRLDKWAMRTWRVAEPESIHELIEASRTSSDLAMAPAAPTTSGPGQGLLKKKQVQYIVLPYVFAWIFTPLIALIQDQDRYGMAIHLVLPWIALAIMLRYPGDFTLFVSSSPRAGRESYVPSISFLWLFSLEYLGFSPAFGAFVGPWIEFLRPALYIGGVLFIVAVALELSAARGWQGGFLLRFVPLLLVSLLYGYVAARELDVMLDRSPDVVTRAVVSHRNAASGSVGLTIEPWGPVTARRNVSVPHRAWRSVRVGDTVCMVGRQGALGVPWYTAQSCPWTGGRTDVGP
jgi:hypothetical protein